MTKPIIGKDITMTTFIRHSKFKKSMRTLLFLLTFVPMCSMQAQKVAVKTNLLYDATLTPNLGVEMTTGTRQSIQLVYGLNNWKYSTNERGPRQAKHWLLMPEYRWWTCSALNGFFVGVHAMGGEFNAGNIDAVIPGVFFKGENLGKGVKDSRYEGKFFGGGVTVGYQWIMSKHWNFEVEAGVGYDHIWYDKYPCSVCGSLQKKAETNYVGLTKLGLSFMYIF